MPPQNPVSPQVPQPPQQYQPQVVIRENPSIQTRVQNWAAGVFVASVAVLTAVSILGIWKVFDRDVIEKSLETLGLLALVSFVVIVAARYVGSATASAVPPPPNPAFRATRNITLVTLIGSAVLLAFLGVLAIWDIIADEQVVYKAISSLALIGFSSFVIVLICLERERGAFWQKHSKSISGWSILGVLIGVWVFIALIGSLF